MAQIDAVRQVSLEYVGFYARQQLPIGVLRHTLRTEAFVAHEMDALVFMMSAYVLGEDGGDEVSDWVNVRLPIRPRWMPKWLWRKIPCRDARWELRCRPKWTYPHSNIQVPDLGPEVKIAVNQGLTRGDGQWR